MSQREKYNKAVQLTNKLAVVMSESGQYEFDIKFSFLSSILERFETGRDCMLIDEDEESSQARDDEVNAAGGEELSEAHDAVSDTEAAATVTADALEGAMVDDYLDGLTTNTNTGYRSQSWDEGVRVAVPAEEPGQSTMQPTSTVADVHVSAPPEDMSDVEPSGTTGRDTTMPTCGVVFQNVSPSSLQEVKIPVARRCRGRPNGTDKSLNVKYGLAQSWKKKNAQVATHRSSSIAR